MEEYCFWCLFVATFTLLMYMYMCVYSFTYSYMVYESSVILTYFSLSFRIYGFSRNVG